MSGEFELIMKNEGIESDFAENWSKWRSAVIDYTMASNRHSAGLTQALIDLPPNPIPSDDVNISYTHGMCG